MEVKNARVLVTGSDGFIGSHLVERLIKAGASVRAFVFYNSLNSWGWLDTLSSDVKSQIDIFPGDIRDSNAVRQAAEGCAAILHLAALISIPFSYCAPDSYVETNINGTLNVLQAARSCETKRVLVTSTSEVYGTAQYVPIDERHPFQGQSPYSATKIGSDRLAESFYRCFSLPVSIVRPFNTYGPRQSARAIIPTIISQLVSGKEEIQLGSLEPTRDLVFVEDTVEGFLKILETEKCIGEEINIATGYEISMGQLARKLISLIRPSAKIVVDQSRIRPLNSEVERLLGDNTKIRSLTGWAPRWTLDEGLKQTIAWFSNRNNLSRYRADLYNI